MKLEVNDWQFWPNGGAIRQKIRAQHNSPRLDGNSRLHLEVHQGAEEGLRGKLLPQGLLEPEVCNTMDHYNSEVPGTKLLIQTGVGLGTKCLKGQLKVPLQSHP